MTVERFQEAYNMIVTRPFIFGAVYTSYSNSVPDYHPIIFVIREITSSTLSDLYHSGFNVTIYGYDDSFIELWLSDYTEIL